MEKLKVLENKGIIGMIHCLPLPGTLHYGGSMQAVIDRALADLDALEKAGVDAAIVENFCDKPNTAKLEPEQLAALLCGKAADLPGTDEYEETEGYEHEN